MGSKRQHSSLQQRRDKDSGSDITHSQVVIHKYPEFIEWLLESFKGIWREKEGLLSNRLIFIVVCAISFVALVIYYPSRAEDYDMWYHFAFGKYFVENRTFILDHSIFSWTPADPNWRYGIWIGSTILYLVYSLLGIHGVYVLQWMIFLCIAFLYFRYSRLMGDTFDYYNILSLLLLFVALNLTAIYIKPELFTTLFFAVSVFLYFYIKHTSKKRLFLIYPPLLFIWVNTHGGYLVGLTFLSIVLFGETVNYLFIKRDQLPSDAIRHLWIAVPLSYIAVIFNPYGIDYHIGIIKTLITPEYMGVATQVYAWIDLWRYILPKDDFSYRFFNTGWLLVLMLTSFVGLNIFAYKKQRFFDITLILIYAFFFYYGMKNARVTLFLPIIWVFSMLYVMKKSDLLSLKKRLTLPSIVTTVLVSVYVIVISLLTLDDRTWFGSNIEFYSPKNEVEFVKKHKLQGPIFNDYLIGGYLIWRLYPDYKVFIDPRYGPYWKEVGPDYFALNANLNQDTLKRFIEKYKFKTAIIHLGMMNLIKTFLTLPDWRLLYFDKTAAVLIHASLIPTLSQETLNTDMGTHRYRDVSNPFVLGNLFNFYINLSPQAAKEIVNIYNSNVTELFAWKRNALGEFNRLLENRMSQIQQQTR